MHAAQAHGFDIDNPCRGYALSEVAYEVCADPGCKYALELYVQSGSLIFNTKGRDCLFFTFYQYVQDVKVHCNTSE